MFPINAQLISALLTSKLDEIIKGQAPEGLKVKEITADTVHLVPENAEMFEGVVINEVKIVLHYRGHRITLTHA